MPNITAGEAPWVVAGLILYALVFIAVGRHTCPHGRRRRDVRPVTPVGERPQDISGDLAEDAAKWDAATAMAHANADVPDEIDATAQIPQYDTIAIAAPEPVALPAATSRSYYQSAWDVSTWRPPEPRVWLTLTWHRPDGPPAGDRFDVTDPAGMRNNQTAEDGELGVKQLWHVLTHQCGEYGGSVKVAVTADGRPVHTWVDKPWDTWTDEAIPVIRDARKALEHAHA